MSKIELLPIFFFLFGSYHLLVGFAASLSVHFTRRIGNKIYRVHLPNKIEPQTEYMLKPLGYYAIFTGVICYWGLLLPLQFQQHLCFAFAGLEFLRAYGRWQYRTLFTSAFSTPWSRSRFNVAFNLTLALIFFWLGTK